ncbi:MAG: DNA polymerase III subunit delta [Rhodospirillaceae bacterium]|nr:DNA polymerase III subunit delta [Rhodospirillales bacterium]MBT3904676.1 DNA polymerase III subunit delta [Rhodospirillaceae bacterium]MBT4701382.1 DNA polymerase III subunit delta [Rhodospirillaceae bacterium]MBT5036210.1 DNA polymerase III subunit delta [Rhodospirillaceae bacterium]MBT6220726.1 DNA polymerase III subunit delta [Rhodospirillaceae bacterium]
MVKISGAKVESFINNPDPAIRAVLVYGPDQGLVHERAILLAKLIVDDLNDPFCSVDISAGDLKNDPARLSDEAAAISFSGGRRVIRIPDGTDGIAKTFEEFLSDPQGDAFVVVEAGTLGPRSKLRKTFEASKAGAALACYEDNNRQITDVIREILSQSQLTATREASAYLEEHLGSDRMVTRKELEKLALFKGAPGEVSLEDAMACVGDNGATSLDSVIYAAAGGDLSGLETALARVLNEGLHPVAILRAIGRHLQRLHLASGAMDKGQSPDQAMKSLRPPIIFKFTNGFRTQLQRWSKYKLAHALELVTEAELECKSTGLPAEAICGRALLRIAQAARKA